MLLAVVVIWKQLIICCPGIRITIMSAGFLGDRSGEEEEIPQDEGGCAATVLPRSLVKVLLSAVVWNT